MRNVNAAGLELIKSFEEFRAFPYQDAGGRWTIGYGHTQGVNAATPAISEAQAEALLQCDIEAAAADVSRLITVRLTDNQFAALVSLTFNCGTAPLTHTLGQLLNNGDTLSAADQFARWIDVAGSPADGLIRRRAAEKALFLTP